jgi:hypothetical protein
MQYSKFHQFWLKITAFIIASFAPVFSLGSLYSTHEPARLTLQILGWKPKGIITYSTPDIHFLSALTGGFLLGWGILVWCLALWVYPIAPEGVRKSVVISLCAWFILDSCGSAASGNYSNVFFNICVLVAAIGPLWKSAIVSKM